jgi:hypothetical protein
MSSINQHVPKQRAESPLYTNPPTRETGRAPTRGFKVYHQHYNSAFIRESDMLRITYIPDKPFSRSARRNYNTGTALGASLT